MNKYDHTVLKLFPHKLGKYFIRAKEMPIRNQRALVADQYTTINSFLVEYCTNPNNFRKKPHFNDIDFIQPREFKYQTEQELNEHVLGSGGFGEIYGNENAFDPGFQYALKVLTAKKNAGNEKFKAANEFKLIQSLEHPSIIKCYGVTTLNGKIYIVMEKGEMDLKTYIRDIRAKYSESQQS